MDQRKEDLRQVVYERLLIDKIRNAVQDCKESLGFAKIRNDTKLENEGRM
jgi:hypothetical protein